MCFALTFTRWVQIGQKPEMTFWALVGMISTTINLLQKKRCEKLSVDTAVWENEERSTWKSEQYLIYFYLL